MSQDKKSSKGSSSNSDEKKGSHPRKRKEEIAKLTESYIKPKYQKLTTSQQLRQADKHNERLQAELLHQLEHAAAAKKEAQISRQSAKELKTLVNGDLQDILNAVNEHTQMFETVQEQLTQLQQQQDSILHHLKGGMTIGPFPLLHPNSFESEQQQQQSQPDDQRMPVLQSNSSNSQEEKKDGEEFQMMDTGFEPASATAVENNVPAEPLPMPFMNNLKKDIEAINHRLEDMQKGFIPVAASAFTPILKGASDPLAEPQQQLVLPPPAAASTTVPIKEEKKRKKRAPTERVEITDKVGTVVSHKILVPMSAVIPHKNAAALSTETLKQKVEFQVQVLGGFAPSSNPNKRSTADWKICADHVYVVLLHTEPKGGPALRKLFEGAPFQIVTTKRSSNGGRMHWVPIIDGIHTMIYRLLEKSGYRSVFSEAKKTLLNSVVSHYVDPSELPAIEQLWTTTPQWVMAVSLPRTPGVGKMQQQQSRQTSTKSELKEASPPSPTQFSQTPPPAIRRTKTMYNLVPALIPPSPPSLLSLSSQQPVSDFDDESMTGFVP